MARPIGSPKLGGRKKGTPNKVTQEKEAQIAASGLTPLDYMLSILRNDLEGPERRMWAAEKAAPYVHPKLAATELSGNLTINHEDVLDDLE